MAASAEKTKSYFPLASGADDGWSTEDEATATCFCGAVQLVFVSPNALGSLASHTYQNLHTDSHDLQPTHGPALVETFVCNCTDCRKITASMFASNFTVLDTHLKHARGQQNLTAFGQARTVASQKQMTNYFCKTCGTLVSLLFVWLVGATASSRNIICETVSTQVI